jgi:hypothetical protein
MINLIYVGKNNANLCRRSFKKYQMKRCGRTVYVRWGRVRVDSRRVAGRVRFAGTGETQKRTFQTVAPAVEFCKAQTLRKLKKGYKRL